MENEFVCDTTGRLDTCLAIALPDLSRSRLQKLIKDGSVQINHKKCTKQAQSILAGDTITIAIDDTIIDSSIVPLNLNLPVLFEDDACLVINKPAGIAVHPAPGMEASEKTILSGIAYLFEERGLPFSADAVLVHRLDKETTGCLLIAKNADPHCALQKQFENRTVKKTYLAIVAGVPKDAEAMIDAPIGRNLTDRTKMSTLKTSVSREAQTTYRTVDTAEDTALLACDLHTGRTHQIRVHLRSIGHPILGDPTYVTGTSEKLTEHYEVSNLCLHAWKLTFHSPATSTDQSVEAPMPQMFEDALSSTGLSL